MSDFVARRQAVLDRFRVLESVPGSGFHDNDPTGPVKQERLRHSERPVLFIDDQECWIIGEDVARVMRAATAFLERERPGLTAESLPEVIRSCHLVSLLRPGENGTGPEMKLPRRYVNDVIWICAEMGLQVNGTGVKE